MPDPTLSTDQFWVLTGDAPAGPFTVEQIHAKLANSEITWQASACPVGSSVWLPLIQTPGIGPGTGANTAKGVDAGPTTNSRPRHAGIATADARSPNANGETGSPPRNSMDGWHGFIGFVVSMLVVAGLIWGVGWISAFLREPTATDICKKLVDAKTVDEAKNFVTPRMYPLVESVYSDPSTLNPNDVVNWTQETDGTQPGTKLVGFRGTWFFQELGKRTGAEGHCKLVKSGGWKVDDMVFTGVEGESLPGPVSLVDEHRKSISVPVQPKSPQTSTAKSNPKPTSTGLQDWYDRNKKLVGFAVIALIIGACKAISEWSKKPTAETR